MKTDVCMISLILILTCLIGCTDEPKPEENDELPDNEETELKPYIEYDYKYSMTVIPFNLTLNGSPEYTIWIEFLMPRSDPFYLINKTAFHPNTLDKKIYQRNNDSAFLQVTSSQQTRIEIYKSYTIDNITSGEHICSNGPYELLIVGYQGDYEYLTIDYFEKKEVSEYVEQASFQGNLTKQGFNSFDTQIESESWQE